MANDPPAHTRIQPHLGTFVSITVYGEPAKVQTAIAAAFDEFRAVDKLLSIHRPDSALARANAGGEVVVVLKMNANAIDLDFV